MTSATSYLHGCNQERLEMILNLAAASHEPKLQGGKDGFSDDLFLRRSKAMRDEADSARRLADAKGRLAWCNDAIGAAEAQRQELGKGTAMTCSALKEKMVDLQKERSSMEQLADAAQVKLQRSAADEIDAEHQRQVIETRCKSLSALIFEMVDEAEVCRSQSKSIWVQRLRELAYHGAEMKPEETKVDGSQRKKDKRSRVEIAEQYEEQAASLHKEIQRLRTENMALTAEAKQLCRSSQQPSGVLEVARRRLLDTARKVKWLEDACAETRGWIDEQDRYRHRLEEKLCNICRKLSKSEATAAGDIMCSERRSQTKLTPKKLDIHTAARCLQARANEEALARGTANMLPRSRASSCGSIAPKIVNRNRNRKAALAFGKPIEFSVSSSGQMAKTATKSVAAEKGQTTLSTADSFGGNDTFDSISAPVFLDIPDHIMPPESRGDEHGFGEDSGGLFNISSIETFARQPLEMDSEKGCLSAPFDIASIEAFTAEIGASLGFE